MIKYGKREGGGTYPPALRKDETEFMRDPQQQDPRLKFKILAAVVFAGVAFLIFPVPATAEPEIEFGAAVDRNRIAMNETIQLSLAFSGTQNVPAPDLPPLDGFEARYLGPSTRVSFMNGQIASSITHNYLLSPKKPGKFQLGPFSVGFHGNTYTSKKIEIEVTASGGSPAPAPPGRSPAGGGEESAAALGNQIMLTMQTRERRVYLNEIVPLTIKLYVNRLSVRDIQYPEFPHPGFSVEEFAQPRQYQEVVGGILYDVIEFDTKIFASRTGELALGPAAVRCNLVRPRAREQRSPLDDFFDHDVFEDFFGRYQATPISLKSNELTVTAADLPAENRPADFAGAVGDFQFELEAGPREVKVGDPVTLKMKIRGEGNFNTVTCPPVAAGDDFKTYEAVVRQEDGAKVFEQVIMPKTDRIAEIPAVTFSFFDPAGKQYRTITRGPVPLKVLPADKEEPARVVESPAPAAPPREKESLGRDLIYLKESPGGRRRPGDYLFRNRYFLLAHLAALLVYVVVVIVYRRDRKLKTDVRYARRRRAPVKAKKGLARARKFLREDDAEKFYGAVFRTLQEYLGDRFHLPSAGITGRVVEETLRPKGIDGEILDGLNGIFRECDQARYASSACGREKMDHAYRALEQIIDRMERQRR